MLLRLAIFSFAMLGLFVFGGWQYMQSLKPLSQEMFETASEKISEQKIGDWIPSSDLPKDNIIPPTTYDESVPDNGTSAAGSNLPVETFPEDESNQLFTPAQLTALKTMGVDTSTLPNTLTTELEACFAAEIGSDRVAAIKAGDMPSMVEFLKAKKCL